MENKMTLKITKDEIFFNCEGYSEEFINAISDVINQRRQSLIESPPTSKLEELPNAGEIENKKTETIGASGIDTNKAEKIKKSNDVERFKPGKRYYKTYERGEKERIIEDVRNEFSFEEINKKYNISKNTYSRIKKNIKAEPAAEKPSKDPAAKISTANSGSGKHRKVGFNPTLVSEEDKLNIAKDIKLGLFASQILKKYHINIHAYAEIKKSIKMEKQKSSADEDDIESVKKRLNYRKRVGGDYSEVSVSKVDINKVQEKINEKPLGPLAVNPGVRQWQKDMIARGL